MNPKLKMILEAQRKHWNNVVLELLNGQKETHWCWYFLPNVPGLGTSDTAKAFAVTPEEFAEFMLNNEYAGNIHTVMFLIDRAYRNSSVMSIQRVMGNNPVDVLKLKSFLTLYRDMICTDQIETPDKPIAHILLHSGAVYGSCRHTEETVLDYIS